MARDKCSMSGDRMSRHAKVPRLEGPYVRVYRPAGDRYPGPDTHELKAGEWYADWVPNDHAFVKGPDRRWHAFGITHPLTSTANVHDGEFLSFHTVAPEGALKDVRREDSWRDLPKVLPPASRPGEILENHAPCIVEKDGAFWMIYGPSPMRLAVSTDLMTWEAEGPLFAETTGARDPCVMFLNGLYYMVFCTQDSVGLRTSQDLGQWSESRLVLRMPDGVAPESPYLLRHDGTFYLFVCGWDGVWDRKDVLGAYEHRTWVFQSDDLTCFDGRREITTLDTHAPELIQGEDGQWYISSAEWPQRGVSLARLVWD